MADINKFFGAKSIINAKAATQHINLLKKKADGKIKGGDLKEATEIYKEAIDIAVKWELSKLLVELKDLLRKTEIVGLKELKEIIEKEAQSSEKNYDYQRARELYSKASTVSTEIFKLGVTEIGKDIKRLKKKIGELEKTF